MKRFQYCGVPHLFVCHDKFVLNINCVLRLLLVDHRMKRFQMDIVSLRNSFDFASAEVAGWLQRFAGAGGEGRQANDSAHLQRAREHLPQRPRGKFGTPPGFCCGWRISRLACVGAIS